MKEKLAVAHQSNSYPDPHHDSYSKTLFGFWLYLMTDFVLFGTLFAIFSVLRDRTSGGPSGQELFSLPHALVQTLILMVASFTSGVAGAYAHRNEKRRSLLYFLITALLGVGFVVMQTAEFSQILAAGHSWKNSAFLSAFFTVTATFWAHMLFAILFTLAIGLFVWKGDRDIDLRSLTRLTCLRQFWQFLYVVWVFIFTIVYLLGVNGYD